MTSVLLTSGDQDVANLLADVLAEEGFCVVRAASGYQAITSVCEVQPDMVLVDTPLADMDGLELCRRLRGGTDAPIVMLAADAREADIVRALELGADEYLLRPVRPRELVARARALLRRSNGFHRGQDEGVILGDVEVRLEERRVYKQGQLVELSPIEFRLLVCLLREAGRVVSHRKLIAQVWGGQYVDCPHYLRLYIGYLRSKLENDPRNPKLILNEWGVGYRLVAPASSGL